MLYIKMYNKNDIRMSLQKNIPSILLSERNTHFTDNDDIGYRYLIKISLKNYYFYKNIFRLVSIEGMNDIKGIKK